jgi:hypothetical protein
MKDFIIYQKGTTKVYIHKGSKRVWRNNKWVKTKLFWYGIRRDDDTGYAALMGVISFSGQWRQYTTQFEPGTHWSSGCKRKICDFEDMITQKWRKSIKRGGK